MQGARDLLLDYARMMRPLNSFMAGIGVVFAILVYNAYTVDDPLQYVLGFTTGFTASAASMLINDYVDLSVDKVNKPWKPLPSGRANPRAAVALSLVLLATALIVNLPLGLPALASAMVYSIVGYMYSFMRRYWWSHFIVSFTTTGPIVYGFMVAGMPASYLPLAALFSTTIFLVNTGREILKAIMDIEGDRRHGYVTVPVKYGVGTARRAMLAAGLTGSVIGVATGLLGYAGLLYTILITLAAAVYIYGLIKGYVNPEDKDRLEKGRKLTIQGMLLGLFAFLAAPLSVPPCF